MVVLTLFWALQVPNCKCIIFQSIHGQGRGFINPLVLPLFLSVTLSLMNESLVLPLFLSVRLSLMNESLVLPLFLSVTLSLMNESWVLGLGWALK